MSKVNWDDFTPEGDTPKQTSVDWSQFTPDEAPTRGIIRSLADTGVAAGRGVATGVKMVADAFGANNAVSRMAKTAADGIGSLSSDYAKDQQTTAAQRMKDAEATGSGIEEVKAGVQNFAERPVDSVVEGLGSSLPTIAAMVLSKGKVNPMSAGATAGAVQGAGSVKGQIYDDVQDRHTQSGASPEIASQLADKAQAYGGANSDQIMIGAGLGAVAGSTGIESGVTRAMSGTGKSGLIRSMAEGVAKEAPMEFAQGGQERLASNIASQREGFAVDTMQGVVGQGVAEGLAGAGSGAGVGAIEAVTARRDAAITTLNDPNAGFLSKAAATGELSGAVAMAEQAKAVQQAAAMQPQAGKKEAAKPVAESQVLTDEQTAVKAPAVPEQIEVSATAPQPQELSAMSDEDLNGRMEYITNQAKMGGGWNPMLSAERARVNQEISARAAAVPVQAPDKSQEILQAAHEAATSPLNDRPDPTDAQKEAGNYKKAHVKVHGLDISIENPEGSTRSGTDADGKAWSNSMQHHYGYIKRTTGADGDHVDTFIGNNPDSTKVFIVDQVNAKTGEFDEHKVMLGFDSLEEAKAAYQSNYAADWQGGKDVSETTVDDFKSWLSNGDTKKPYAKGTADAQQPDAADVPLRYADAGSSGSVAEKQPDITEASTERAGPVADGETDTGTPSTGDAENISSADTSLEQPQTLADVKPGLKRMRKAKEGKKKQDATSEEGNADNPEAAPEVAQPPAVESAPTPVATTDKPGLKKIQKAKAERQEVAQSISDMGEKIGGARKDTAQPVGSRSKVAKDPETDSLPAWRKRFVPLENVTGDKKNWVLVDTKTEKAVRSGFYAKEFATEQEAIDAIPLIAVSQKHRVVDGSRSGEPSKFEIWRTITDRKRVKVVNESFATRDDAMRYMAANAAQILDVKTSFGEEILAKPEKVLRTGVSRRTGKIDGESFMETFGFRGVEFGNWNNNDERQEVMNHAFDGLLDLADVLGVPPKALSLNGELGLAFGARGQGLSGARAHYERDYAVMNLTKMKGAGALAHEWFHSLDHYLGRQDGKASPVKEKNARGDLVYKAKGREADYVSHGFRYSGSGVRQEVRDAYDALMKTMYTKAEQYVEDTERAEKFVGATRDALRDRLSEIRKNLEKQLDPKFYKRNNKPASSEQLAEFDQIANELIDGQNLETEYRLKNPDGTALTKARLAGRYTNDSLEKLNAIYKAVRGRAGFNTERSGVLDSVRMAMTRYADRVKMLNDANVGAEKTKKVPTSYAMESKRIDQGRATDYWTTEHEMAARAFSAYVEDKLGSAGNASDFLSFGSDNKFFRLYDIRPFPEGKEREAINTSFDKLFATLQAKETDKGVALYDRGGMFSTGMQVKDVKAEVERLAATWKNAPKINVVESKYELPFQLPTGASFVESENGPKFQVAPVVRGVYQNGQVWLVAEHLESEADVQNVLFHEVLGHAGLRGFFGDELNGELIQLAKSNINIRYAAAKWREENKDIKGQYTAERWEAVSIEEVLADIAGSGRKINGWQRFRAYVQKLLRAIGFVKFADDMEAKSDAEALEMLFRARSNVENGAAGPDLSELDGKPAAGNRQAGGLSEAQAYSRGEGNTDEKALATLAEIDEIFRLPKSDKKTVEDITRDNAPGVAVRKNTSIPGETRFNFIMPDGKIASLTERTPTINSIYASSLEDGEFASESDGLPGKNAESVENKDQVYIDVSTLESAGGYGAKIYNIAATYAHNTGKLFIGDPAGLSDQALRRRPEQMLSSALKFGTTEHLAPHPRQLKGDRELGVPGLDWVHGDHIGNIRKLIALNMKLVEKAGGNLDISYNTSTGKFEDSDGNELTRDDITGVASLALGPTSQVGGSTLARYALFKSLVQGEGRQVQRSDGILASLVEQLRQYDPADSNGPLGDLFYSRGSVAGSSTKSSSKRVSDTVMVDGIARPTLDSTGRVIGHTDAVRKAFWKWFGDSKAVDANGRPLVVYHGTDADFDSFVTGGDGAFFTTNRQAAEDYGDRVISAYLRVTKPVEFTAEEWTRGSGLTTREARAQGYDGFLVRDHSIGGEPDTIFDDTGDTWTAFSPTQIKSVNNVGGFNPNAPEIMYSRGTVAGTVDTLRSSATLRQATGNIKSLLASDRKFGLWDRTIGTQFNKATKDADFKRVFDALNQQTDDTAHYAIESEKLAPSVLQRLDSVKDIFKALGQGGGQHQKDMEAVAKPLFANIEGEQGVQQKVFPNDELVSQFKLTPKQIEMYREVRLSVDTSIDRLAQSTIAAMGQAVGLNAAELKGLSLEETARAVKDKTEDGEVGRNLPGMEPTKHAELHQRIDDIVEHAGSLKAAGYMPAMRFGQYAVTVKDPSSGEVQYFSMYESQFAANVAAKQLEKDYPGSAIEKAVMNPDQFAMFKGVSPETVELFAKFSGMDENEAFQDYIALAKSGRSAMKRMLARKGIAGFSDDTGRVLAQFITSNARQAALNFNGSEVTAALAAVPKSKGDVQQQAQKLVDYIQNPQEEAQALRGFLFMNFLGGSVASAAVNLTQPVLQTTPYLTQYAGKKTPAIMIASAKMAATGKVENAELRAALERAAADGITEPHEIHNLMADASGSTLGTGIRARALTKAWGAFFSLSEAYNRRLTFLAAYQTAMNMGPDQLRAKGFDDAYAFAKRAIIETQGLYSKTNRPNWARGAVGATLFTFKQFSIGYIEFLNRLPPKQKAIALGILVMAAGLQGLPFAEDIEDLIDSVGQSMGYNTNSQQSLREFARNTFGETAGAILTHGISTQSGVDLHGRLGLGNLIPGSALFKPSEVDKGRDALQFAGPLGSVIQSFQKAFTKVQSGNITGKTGALAEVSPVAIKNMLQAGEMAQTGQYKDSKGRKVMDTTPGDAAAKFFGFQPSKVAAESRKISDTFQNVSMVRQVESSIADTWAQGIAEKDSAKIEAARKKLIQWNLANPDSRIMITPAQLRNRVMQMQTNRQQRFVKTAPKELRAGVMKEIQ